MELKFQKAGCRFLDIPVDQIQNQELTQEIRLSDDLPDIGRVLSAWGQVILRSKEWRSDSIAFSAGMMVWVLYAPEDGTAPRCIEGWLPFQMKYDMEPGYREGSIRIQCLTRFVDARPVAARKIMVRAGVSALTQAVSEREAEYGIPGELPEDVQMKKAHYPVRLIKASGEKAFQIDEDLSFPGSCPPPEKIVYYTMHPRIADSHITGNRIVFQGTGNLHLLYMGEDGQLHSWDFELPFSQFGDFAGNCSSDARGNVAMALTSLELDKDSEGRMRLKCGMLAQYLVDDREMLELVEDAYSPTRTVKTEMELLVLPAILEQRTERVKAQQTIHHDAERILDGGFLPDFPRQRRAADALQMEMQGQFQVLFCGENGMLQSAQAWWEGDWQMSADSQSRITAAVTSIPRTHTSGQDGIHMETDVELGISAMARQEIPMVVGLELGEHRPADPQRPSVILRRAGESTFWEIAKSTGTTVEAIQKANALDEEPPANQILLIPVM